MLATKLIALLFAALFTGAAGANPSFAHPLAPNSSPSPASNSSIAPHHDSTPFSTRMLSSIILRQQGLVSSGQSTSTLESGFISLAIQSWLSLYASPTRTSTTTSQGRLVDQVHNDLSGEFSDYVDSILASLSTMSSFTNVTQTALLPLDRLTVAQYVQPPPHTSYTSQTFTYHITQSYSQPGVPG